MLADQKADQAIGTVLGGAYRLVRRIGEGGMGGVYEAEHLRLHNRVAVKLMSRSNSSNQVALARFHREAIVASRLGHPHLVNVMDFGIAEGGQPYIVMEFLHGEDLDRRIVRMGTIPLEEAVRITRQTASAVAAVHTRGIVHRDLKPSNIFLVHVEGEEDFVKVLDFGISKIRALRSKLTEASRVVGTPEYMSPEQTSGPGDDVDHRTDQWALACMVWEMLTGRVPFTSDDPTALFYQLRNLPPPPLAMHAPNAPPAVEPVLLRALAKQPDERFSSITDFARAFETAVLGPTEKPSPDNEPTVIHIPSRPRRLLRRLSRNLGVPYWRLTNHRVSWIAAAVAGAAIALLLLFVGLYTRATVAKPALNLPNAVASPAEPAPAMPISPTPPTKEAPTKLAPAQLAAAPSPPPSETPTNAAPPHAAAAVAAPAGAKTPAPRKGRSSVLVKKAHDEERGGGMHSHRLTLDDF